MTAVADSEHGMAISTAWRSVNAPHRVRWAPLSRHPVSSMFTAPPVRTRASRSSLGSASASPARARIASIVPVHARTRTSQASVRRPHPPPTTAAAPVHDPHDRAGRPGSCPTGPWAAPAYLPCVPRADRWTAAATSSRSSSPTPARASRPAPSTARSDDPSAKAPQPRPRAPRHRSPPPHAVPHPQIRRSSVMSPDPLNAYEGKPTPGIEPGTPSLRVAHLQGFCRIYGLLILVSAGWVRSELLSSGHGSGHAFSNGCG
jgi:hypothetical protein